MPLPQAILHRNPDRWETEWSDALAHLKDLKAAQPDSEYSNMTLFDLIENSALRQRVNDQSHAYITRLREVSWDAEDCWRSPFARQLTAPRRIR